MGGGHDEKEQTLEPAAGRARRLRLDQRALCCWRPPTARRSSIRRCCARAASIARCWSTARTRRAASTSCACTQALKLAAELELEKWQRSRPGSPAPISRTSSTKPRSLATRRKHEAVTLDDFTLAIERIVAGLEKKNRLLNPREREIVAYHEAGHALVARALPSVDAGHKVSIIPRGIGALGYTMQRPTEDRYLMTREELEDKLAVLLAGRAAETLVFGHLSRAPQTTWAKRRRSHARWPRTTA